MLSLYLCYLLQQVGALVSAERGTRHNVLCCKCTGQFNAPPPPMLIFPRVHFKREIFLNGAPPGTVGTAYPSGWMTSDNFLVFLKHFVHQSNDSKATHVILL